jgi:hypothetical protein
MGEAAMEIEKKRFKTLFPHLSEEMERKQNRVSVSSVRSDVHSGEHAVAKRFDGYMPDVVDFLRRCDNDKQAEEIIDYLENRNEIDGAYARRLRKQLKEKGVRSFGPKKQDDYYSREGIV